MKKQIGFSNVIIKYYYQETYFEIGNEFAAEYLKLLR